ncbi:hypothetical protein FXO37_20754 [Capsicum annuum]|nr:hypothetical protein FXO37_20754 [Capsicum annuum]
MNREARIWRKISYHCLIQGKHITDVMHDKTIPGRQAQNKEIKTRMYGLQMLQLRVGGFPATHEEIQAVEMDYYLGHHARTMLRIGTDFIELVDDDVPTEEELRMCNLNIESDEMEYTDDPDLGA